MTLDMDAHATVGQLQVALRECDHKYEGAEFVIGGRTLFRAQGPDVKLIEAVSEQSLDDVERACKRRRCTK